MGPEELKLKDSRSVLLSNKQICVIDDDESVCRSISLLLAAYGLETQTFLSASEFLNSVLKHAPGCLILDVHMKGMDGFALQQRLAGNGFRIPIIFMSVDKDIALSKQYLKATGAAGFLQKPFNDQALIDFITIALEKKEYEGNEGVGAVEALSACQRHVK